MKSEIADLKPTSVWKHFTEIAQIPRCSRQEEKILEHLKRKAQMWGLSFKQDRVGNLCVSKPASRGKEDGPVVVLQGHVDMVCEQNRGRNHDFSCDPIELVLDNGWIRANETTLGADNGIAVAYMLALLEDATLVHGPVECLFTIDEESALTGALNLDPTLVSGKILINLDSEDVGHFTVGCAGGATSHLTIPLQLEKVRPNHAAFGISLKGLKGGHSGVEIHKQRGNALLLTSRFVAEFFESRSVDQTSWGLASIEGGDKHNAIPRECFVLLTGPADGEKTLKEFAKKSEAVFRAELGPEGSDLAIAITAERLPASVLDQTSQARALLAITALPDGVQGMSRLVPGLVETSCNVAAIKIEGNALKVMTSQRSSMASLRDELGRRIGAVAQLAGGTIAHADGYPAWTPRAESALRDRCVALWKRTSGRDAIVELVHAGLECGVIGDKVPGMDMISFGPDIQGPHTPTERVNVASVAQVWDFLLVLLKELGN